MKRLTAIILTCVLAAGIFSGCVMIGGKQSGPNPSNKGIAVNKIKFENLQYDELSEDKKELVDKLKASRGYYAWEENGSYIILISLGEKPTGGYTVEVDYIEDNEGVTNIIVKEEAPAAGDVVTTVITYPYVLVKAKGITDNFNVENTKGEKFNLLQASNNTVFENVEGVYVGAIDSNFVEIIINNQPQSFMITEVADKIKSIRDGDAVVISYEKNEHGQFILKNIKKK